MKKKRKITVTAEDRAKYGTNVSVITLVCSKCGLPNEQKTTSPEAYTEAKKKAYICWRCK